MPNDVQTLLNKSAEFVAYGPGETSLIEIALLLANLFPPMTYDAQSLITSAEIYNLSPGDMQLIKLALLKQIAVGLNPAADLSPQALITSVNEYNSLGPGSQSMIELALLKNIAGG